MHSVLIVATVDRGHGDSVGRQVGEVPWEQAKVLVVLRSAPIVACSRGVGRRVDPRAARNALHVGGDRNENGARFSSPKGTDQPPHSRCVEFDHDDDGSHEVYDS